MKNKNLKHFPISVRTHGLASTDSVILQPRLTSFPGGGSASIQSPRAAIEVASFPE